MKRYTLVSVVLIVTIAIVTIISFQQHKEGGAKRIALVVTSLENPYFIEMSEGARKEAATQSKVELSVYAPKGGAVDAERQLEIIRTLVAQKVDLIAVVPADSVQILSAIELAGTSGIPILVLDNDVNRSVAAQRKVKFDAFIGSDNVAGGRMAGDFMAHELGGQGEVAILEGVAGVEAGLDRKKGFEETIQTANNIRIVASQTANWDREQAFNVTQAILAANPKINGIFGANDEMALGAARAIKAKGLEHKIVVVGYDATPDGRAAVESGELAATVAQQPFLVGAKAVQIGADILRGKATPYSNIEIPLSLIKK